MAYSSPRTHTRRFANRRELLEELSSSESRYMKTLKACINSYLVPLRDSRALSPTECGAVFRCLETLRDVHSKLHGVISTGAEEDNVASGMAIVANEFTMAKAAILDLYIPYARGHESAMRLLRSAASRPDVSRLMERVATTDERVRAHTLEDLLAAPLDRCLEYKDLLTQLLSLSSPADRGYTALSDAVDSFTSILKEAALAGYTPPPPPPSNAAAAAMSLMGAHSTGNTLVFSGGGYPTAASSAPATASNVNDLLSRTGLMSSPPPPAKPTAYPPFHPSEATSSIVAAAMPAPPSPAHTGTSSALMRADMEEADVPLNLSPDVVIAAAAEAEEASKRLEALEREVSLKEAELQLSTKEVMRAEAEKMRRPAPDTAPMDDALRKLNEEEKELLSRLQSSEQRALFEAFLSRKRELEDEEARLNAALAEHEDTLAQVRARLANPPASVLPSDPAKASLYITWKRALAEREELLRAARRRKHELLRDLKARHETQVILLEMERRAAVENLQESVTGERAKVDAYKRDIAALEESIEGARSAMKRFRQEFEQLRVALLIDRMAKSSQVANLADRRRRLAKEAEAFQEAVEAAKQRVAAEEAAKWEAKLAAEREAGEARVAEERRLIEAKIEKVRSALAERYEAGFKPLLKEAEARHVEELQKIVDLQRELEAKEGELRAAHEAARAVSSAVAELTDAGDSSMTSAGEGGSGGQVPEWKLREFEDLKNAVTTMWESLDVPAEDITAFLSECDLLAPFHPKVLEMYQDMYRRLTNAAAAAAAAAAPSSPPQALQDMHDSNGYSSRVSGGSPPGQHHHSWNEESAPPPAPAYPRPTGGGYGSATTPSMSSAGLARRVGGGTPAVAMASPAQRSARKQDEDMAYLQRATGKPLPPSLGGPGSRGVTPGSRGSAHVPTSTPGFVRRSPSPDAAARMMARRMEV